LHALGESSLRDRVPQLVCEPGGRPSGGAMPWEGVLDESGLVLALGQAWAGRLDFHLQA
jgi:hypothetical protein